MTDTSPSAPDATPAAAPATAPANPGGDKNLARFGLRTEMLQQAVSAMTLRDTDIDVLRARADNATDMISGLGPQNELEQILVAQMVATHHTAMECIYRAAQEADRAGSRHRELHHAGRMMALQLRQIEALGRLRGKAAQQKVTVEHVHVEAGGQAVVGTIQTVPRPDGPPPGAQARRGKEGPR